MEYVTLNNGVKMPKLGFGVFQMTPEQAEASVLDAISVGYRHIDTAQRYGNEEGVGNAISKCGVPRKELFITTKIKITNAGYEKAKASIEESLKKLKTDYVDLLLVHHPFGDYYGTWRAMEEALKEGKTRAIGLSNFYPDRLADFCHFNEIKPSINQVETHVFRMQKKAHEYMTKLGIVHESWAPFAEGKKDFFTNPILVEIGKKYNKTPAQVGLRYLLENDVVVIPKSVHKERMAENINVFDFHLSDDDKKKIATLDGEDTLFGNHYDPGFVEYMYKIS